MSWFQSLFDNMHQICQFVTVGRLLFFSSWPNPLRHDQCATTKSGAVQAGSRSISKAIAFRVCCGRSDVVQWRCWCKQSSGEAEHVLLKSWYCEHCGWGLLRTRIGCDPGIKVFNPITLSWHGASSICFCLVTLASCQSWGACPWGMVWELSKSVEHEPWIHLHFLGVLCSWDYPHQPIWAGLWCTTWDCPTSLEYSWCKHEMWRPWLPTQLKDQVLCWEGESCAP